MLYDGEAEHHNNVMIASPGGTWALPASPNRAAWEFVDCGGELTAVINSEYQAFPNPFGFMVFADLPGQSGVLQAGPFEGQEFDISDGAYVSTTGFGEAVTGSSSGKWRVRYGGSPLAWRRIG